MKAGRLVAVGAPPVVVDLPVPEPGPGEVRVAVRACGVCGSDVHVLHGVTPTGPLPLTLGHEASGVVDALGPGVDGPWAPGDRVVIAAGWGCGACAACDRGDENLCPAVVVPGIDRDGAQAGYAVAPARALVPLPDTVDFVTGAILTDAVATPYHALRRAGVAAGDTVAVFGLGGLGLPAVALCAQVLGATAIGVDPSPKARERALAHGAAEVVDPSDGKPARRLREVTGGVDHAIELVGAAAVVDQAVKSLRPGGTCTVVGITPEPLHLLPQALLVSRELRVQGSFGCAREDLADLVRLVADGRLDLAGTVTHTYPLAELAAALRTLATKEGDPVRVVVDRGFE